MNPERENMDAQSLRIMEGSSSYNANDAAFFDQLLLIFVVCQIALLALLSYKILKKVVDYSCCQKFKENLKQDNGIRVPNDQLIDSNVSSLSSETSALPQYLDEKIVDELIERGKRNKNHDFSELKEAIDDVFSNPNKLSESFRCDLNNKSGIAAGMDFFDRSNGDSSLPSIKPANLCKTQVDVKSLRRSMKKIFDLDDFQIGNQIENAIIKFAESLSVPLCLASEEESEAYMHCFVIFFDLMICAECQFFGLSELCHAVRHLCISHHARLAHIWAENCKDHLHSFVQICQEEITSVLITTARFEFVHQNFTIRGLTRILKIAFYASILAGEIESFQSSKKVLEDELENELGLSVLDSCNPLISFEEFYNDELSEAMQQYRMLYRDFHNYLFKSEVPDCDEEMCFSFMEYSFILSPVAKIKILYYYQSQMNILCETRSPYFKLNVRRENILEDVFVALKKVVNRNPEKLTKQLCIKFVGEEAIDQGGVSKEFFEIIIEKLFSPNLGLFSYQEDTNTVWFDSMSEKKMVDFKLAGIIFGLAISNQVNMAVNFPKVIYRKLMNGRALFNDLKDWDSNLYQSLKSFLDYEGDDMENCFMQTFKIIYSNVNGQVVEHELKPGGNDILVGQENKQEFVDLYSDFLLNQSIKRQFVPFKRGFAMVTGGLPLKMLFRPDEFELLVCGSKTFNFLELEQVTKYAGGYTAESRIIKDFWNIVHAMPDEMKEKLLEFTTGSSRVPAGGFYSFEFIIERAGTDCVDRLPTSLTCFNKLLLPEYRSKVELEERLLKALEYSKGFGML